MTACGVTFIFTRGWYDIKSVWMVSLTGHGPPPGPSYPSFPRKRESTGT